MAHTREAAGDCIWEYWICLFLILDHPSLNFELRISIDLIGENSNVLLMFIISISLVLDTTHLDNFLG